MDIKESFEPVCYPPNKKLEDFMSKVKGGINSKKDKDKDKSFVNKLLEDMTVNITDVNGSISFLSTDRLSDGPSISFNLASLMLRSTDSQWNVVDLAKIHEIPKGSRHYFMHKEIFIGSLVASVNDPFHPYVDFVKTQPVSLRVKY